MCKEGRFKPLITVQEKTANSPAKFIELLTSEGVRVDDDIYTLMQALNDEVL